MKATKYNSLSFNLKACTDEKPCQRCNNLFSLTSLHDGFCFSCGVEIFKANKLEQLGFGYGLPVFAGEVSI